MKFKLLLLFSFCIITSNCYAQKKVKTKTVSKVVKVLPTKSNKRVNDFEGILTTKQEGILDSIIRNFEKETSNEIAFVSIGKDYTTKENFDSTILMIHNMWGVGKKNVDNGIVIGISSGLKKIRISNGYGIVDKLTNEMTKTIIEDLMIPSFKENNYYEGILKGLMEIVRILR
jgi:uncharacterized protein